MRRWAITVVGLLFLAGVLNAGRVTYTYDAAGRLRQVSYANGTMIEYTYDPGGNMVQQRLVGMGFAAHMASTPDWFTRVAVVNIGAAASPMVLKAIDAGGLELETVTLPELPPGAAYEADIGAIFTPETLGHDLWMQLEGNPGSLRGVLLFGTRDNQTVVTIPLSLSGSRALVFPYVFAAGGLSYYTGITLVNTAPTAAKAVLHAYSEGGTLLQSVPVEIPARGKYVRLLEWIFTIPNPNLIRALHVDSDQPLIGFELFGMWTDKGLSGLPVFDRSSPPSAKKSARQLVYPELPPDYYTGMTFSNLGSTPADVHVNLFDAGGGLLAEADWNVTPDAQVTRQVWGLFDGQEHPGATHVTAVGPSSILGFELYLSLTAGTPFRFDGVPAAAEGGDRLCFPLVRTGTQWASWLSLVNRELEEASVTVRAFSATGVELGQSAAVIPGRGKVRRSLSEMFPGALDEISWIRVDSGRSLTGSLLFISSDLTRMGSYLGTVEAH